MRPLFVGGIRPSRFASIVLELQTKAYTKAAIEAEQDLRKRRQLDPDAEGRPLSFFADAQAYNGYVPSGAYFSEVNKAFGRSIRKHLDTEVKKRGAEILKWDVSYKEAKHLCQYHGQGIFRGLVTGTNELGEIRVQFHVVSDSHEQMESQLRALTATLQAYGKPLTRMVFGDKPAEENLFFLRMLPGVHTEQGRLDALGGAAHESVDAATAGLDSDGSSCSIDLQRLVKVAYSSDDMERLCLNVHTVFCWTCPKSCGAAVSAASGTQ